MTIRRTKEEWDKTELFYRDPFPSEEREATIVYFKRSAVLVPWKSDAGHKQWLDCYGYRSRN